MVASPSPRTWSDGQVVSGAALNREVRDQFRASALHIATSRGQVPYAVGNRELAMLDVPSVPSALYHPSGFVAPQWRAATASNLIENGGLTADKMGAGEAADAIAAGELTNAQLADGAVIGNIGPFGIDTPQLADDCATARTIDDAAVLEKLRGSNRLPITAFNQEIRNRLGLDPQPFFVITAPQTRSFTFSSAIYYGSLLTTSQSITNLPFDAVSLQGSSVEYNTIETATQVIAGRSIAGAIRIGPGYDRNPIQTSPIPANRVRFGPQPAADPFTWTLATYGGQATGITILGYYWQPWTVYVNRVDGWIMLVTRRHPNTFDSGNPLNTRSALSFTSPSIPQINAITRELFPVELSRTPASRWYSLATSRTGDWRGYPNS